MGPRGQESALIRAATAEAGSARLAAIFSGQGYDYMAELRTACDSSPGALCFVSSVCTALAEESHGALRLGLHEHGLEVIEWLRAKANEPPVDYLRSAPISYPLVFVTQVCHSHRLTRHIRDTPMATPRRMHAFTTA